MTKSRLKLCLSALLLLALTVAALLTLTGCGDKVEQIYVDKANSPRLTYVQGQELDLTTGKLTVLIGEDMEESHLPLNAEGITVSGYEKDKLGSQTVVIKYEEQATSITVNVIPRMVAEGFETGYFTGDSFKRDKGKLKVAKDDGTTFMVPFDDTRITFSTWNSTTAGEKTVTATFSDGGNSYSCTFKVNVYDAATSSITIVYPKKTTYGSHETELDFTGGYITIKGGADGKLEKHVNITEATISGYNPAAATPTSGTVSQKITISYLGKTFTYTVKITYSSVSVVLDQLEILNEIDFTGDDVTLNAAEKAASWTAVKEYYALNNKDKEFFTEDQFKTIIRAATVGVSELYREELGNYDKTIIVNSQGLALAATTYEDTKANLAKLRDKNEILNQYAVILRWIADEHKDIILVGDVLVGSRIFVMSTELQTNLVSMLYHMVDIYEDLDHIPEDWTVASLLEDEKNQQSKQFNEAAIGHAVQNIKASGYYKNGNGAIYEMISGWRKNDDFFEIIYSYYLYVNTETYGEKYVVESVLNYLPWPKTIEAWYIDWYQLTNISTQLKNATGSVYMYDLSPYVYYYNQFIDKTNAIKANGNDKLTLDLYRILSGDSRVLAARYGMSATEESKGSYGYYHIAGFLADEVMFSSAIDSIVNLIDLYATGKLSEADGKFVVTGNEAAFDAVMNAIGTLSPANLRSILSTLNFGYSQVNGDALALSLYTFEKDGEEVSTYLNTVAMLLHAYYKVELDEDYEIAEKLIYAIENYSLIGFRDGAKENFKTAMAEVITKYTALQDKTAFNGKLEAVYTFYANLYDEMLEEENVTVDAAAQARIDALIAKFKSIAELNAYITEELKKGESAEVKAEAYLVIFALYERARYEYLSLTDAAATNESLRIALYNNLYEIATDTKLTIEQMYFSLGSIYWNYMLGMPNVPLTTAGGQTVGYPFYDLYLNTSFTEFLINAADILLMQYNEASFADVTAEEIGVIISKYNKLDNISLILLSLFGGDELYFDALESYFGAKLTDTTEKTLAEKIVDLAKAYAAYATSGTEEKLNAFKAKLDAAKAIYDTLSIIDENLVEMYDHYTALWNKLNTPEA